MIKSISPDEARWRAEEDARTLARAEEIKSDPTRVKNASVAAQELLRSREEEISGLRKVASKQAPKNTPPKTKDGFPLLQKRK